MFCWSCTWLWTELLSSMIIPPPHTHTHQFSPCIFPVTFKMGPNLYSAVFLSLPDLPKQENHPNQFPPLCSWSWVPPLQYLLTDSWYSCPGNAHQSIGTFQQNSTYGSQLTAFFAHVSQGHRAPGADRGTQGMLSKRLLTSWQHLGNEEDAQSADLNIWRHLELVAETPSQGSSSQCDLKSISMVLTTP